MDQEMMQLKHELKELVERANHILQKMDGSMGQRYYGMRGGSGYGGGNYNGGGGSGGDYGNREPWMQGGYPQQEQWPNVDPRWFM
jgi:uncharacterized membrane protein